MHRFSQAKKGALRPVGAGTRPLARRLAGAAATAILLAACSKGGAPATTGSISDPAERAVVARGQLEALGRSFDAKPGDPERALAYGQALRDTGQHSQAVAVLQQAAIRNPKHLALLGAYGKALTEVGRLREASEVLSRAHMPERPDWRILSAQGAVADQLGEHAQAQEYYEAALKIVPGEPSVLSNLGLSYALSKRLPEGERVLREAAAHPRADARVRQNLALVLGLQGRLDEAEKVLRQDLKPEEVAANIAAMRANVSQVNSWDAIRQADGSARAKRIQQAAKDPL